MNTPYTVTANEQTDEVFRYFEGGKGGIQKRFGEGIQQALRAINGFDAGQLAVASGLTNSEIPRICSGDFSCINRSVIEALADPLSLSIEKCLGQIINFDADAEKEWTERAREDQFVPIGGVTDKKWDAKTSAKLFLVIQAVEML